MSKQQRLSSLLGACLIRVASSRLLARMPPPDQVAVQPSAELKKRSIFFGPASRAKADTSFADDQRHIDNSGITRSDSNAPQHRRKGDIHSETGHASRHGYHERKQRFVRGRKCGKNWGATNKNRPKRSQARKAKASTLIPAFDGLDSDRINDSVLDKATGRCS